MENWANKAKELNQTFLLGFTFAWEFRLSFVRYIQIDTIIWSKYVKIAGLELCILVGQ